MAARKQIARSGPKRVRSKKVGEERAELDQEFLSGVEMSLGIGDVEIEEHVDYSENLPSPLPRVLIPGICDLQLAKVSRLGRRERFPRPHDWENLLPMLAAGDELLWIARKYSSRFDFYFGLKRNSFCIEDPGAVVHRKSEFRSILSHFKRRAFPESIAETLDSREIRQTTEGILSQSNGMVTVISGVPSPKAVEEEQLHQNRDEAVRLFASLNDVLEPFLEEDPFTIVFTLCRATGGQIAEEISKWTQVVDLLRPLTERQDTGSESKTKGGQRSKTQGTSDSESETEQWQILRKFGALFTGTHQYGTRKPRRVVGPGRTVTKGQNASESEGSNWSTQEGTSSAVTHVNSRLRLIHDAAERLLKHLRQTPGTGGYFVSASVYAEGEPVGRKIGKALAGALSGADSYIRPFQIVSYRGEVVDLPLRRAAPVSRFLKGIALLNNSQASQFLMVPEADMPGIAIKKNVFYGQSALSETKGRAGATDIGSSAYLEDTRYSPEEKAIRVPHQDLLSHVLVTGTTGSGKTVRTTQILNSLDPEKFRLIVIETAKKTYRHKLNRGGERPQVFTVGVSDRHPLRINPFYFDEGTSLKRHVSVLSDALSDLLPVEALIGPKLREAITSCYFRLGWNFENSKYERDGDPIYPTMIDFNVEVLRLCERLQYGPELTQNYLGALTGRARLFIDDIYQDIFAAGGNLPFDKLFWKDTIIEMDELPPSEIQMPGFLLSVIIERLRAFQSAAISKDPPAWLLVVEEAHNLLSRKLEDPARGNEMGSGSRLLEQVVRLLQEGRELGIGVFVIDQSPRSLV